MAAGCPFTAEEVSAAESASAEALDRFAPYANEKEQFRTAGREVYLLFSDSVRNSKLAANMHKLDASATVRNWKTVNKLVSLAEGMG